MSYTDGWLQTKILMKDLSFKNFPKLSINLILPMRDIWDGKAH